MTNKAMILIGIGTSGLRVLEEVQNFHYENIGRNKPAWVEYLYIETNKDNAPSITALTNEIKRVYISLGDMENMMKDLKEDKRVSTSWLPPEDHVIDAGLGAGGIPSCGRLALWGRNRDGNNFHNVINAIQDSYTKVAGPGAKYSDSSEPVVFITGSVTGGTGTGIFLDMAYLVRNLIPGIKELYSLLMIPPKPAVIRGSEIVYSNAYSALRALRFYNFTENKYTYDWPSGENREFKEPPFELTQIISQSYNDATPPLQTLSGLFKLAGLYLFLNVIGLRAKRFERLVDAKGNMQMGKYGTFGLSGIQYPKAQIQEYLSLELSIELLNRWLDKQFYWSGNSKESIDPSVIITNVKRRFGTMLRSAFDLLDSSGQDKITRDIEVQTQLINKNEQADTPKDYLFNLFSSANREGYYSKVMNNLQFGVDEIIQGINEHVIEDFNRYENLHYTKTQLEAYQDAINEVLKYWKSIGISSFAKKWDEKLIELTSWMLGNRHKMIGEQNNVLKDRMKSTLDHLRMHLMVVKLLDIRDNIKTADVPLRTATLTNGTVELPTIYKINNMRKAVERAVGKRDDAETDTRFKSFLRRKSEIEGDMSDETIPILRIFPTGDFYKEVNQSHQNYKNLSNNTFPSKDTVIGEESLWNYLSQSTLDMHKILYGDCILKFKQELNSYDATRDYDVSEYVEKYPEVAIKFAEKSKSFLLPIRNRTLRRSQNIPKMVIGSDKNVIKQVISRLRDANFTEFSGNDDNIKEIPELKNIMVFYIEQSNFEPLEDISYFKTEVTRINNDYPEMLGMSKEKWFNFRNPYINFDEASSKNPPDNNITTQDREEYQQTSTDAIPTTTETTAAHAEVSQEPKTTEQIQENDTTVNKEPNREERDSPFNY